MARVLLLGYFGAGNLGDDGLLVDWLERYGQLLRRHGAVADVPVHSDTALQGYVESPEVTSLVGAMLPRQQLLRASPRQYAALVAPGGSLLQDTTSLRSLAFYLGVIHRFARAGVPVLLLNQGVGPLRNPLSRWFTPQALSLTRMLSLRDADSYEWAKAQLALVAHKELYLAADPLLAGRLDPAQLGLAQGGYFVVVPKPPTAAPDEAAYSQSAAALAQLIGAVRQASGRDALVLPLHGGQDVSFAEQVAVQAGAQLVAPASSGAPPHAAAIALLAGAELTLSYRLHGVVLSAAHGTPALGVAYDPKVSALCRELELPSVRPQDVLRGQATRTALALWENRAQMARNMNQRRAAMLDRLQRAEARVDKLLAEALT